ncbi:MAG: hypothetical protein IPP85_16370 [Propionivibrio sp.]|nr:hypothetical protein [Propionivibrio sp.]
MHEVTVTRAVLGTPARLRRGSAAHRTQAMRPPAACTPEESVEARRTAPRVTATCTLRLEPLQKRGKAVCRFEWRKVVRGAKRDGLRTCRLKGSS